LTNSGPALALREDVDLTSLNTLRLPARARYYAEATSRQALKAQLQWARDRQLPCLVLGGGSNVVFRQDFPGLVVRMALRGRRWCQTDGRSSILELEAGESWHESVLYAARTGFRGIENLALIPGTVGAAPVQNIGAYGVELADTLVDVEVLDTQTMQLQRLERDACEFGYRESLFKRERGRYLITQVRLELSRERGLVLDYRDLADAFPNPHRDRLMPLQVAETVMAIRRSKLPDPQHLPNAGSFFKNPVVDQAHYEWLTETWPDIIAYPDPRGMKLAAGWMIDRCGWKGYHDSHVGVHRRQALVLVNHTRGTGQDILNLASRIQADVQARFDVLLETEPRVIP
jgi:UDP-N-acetylmuramate dehydrogenase